MKKFEAAQLVELNISETANGFVNAHFEGWFIHNDSLNTPEEIPTTDNDFTPTDMNS